MYFTNWKYDYVGNGAGEIDEGAIELTRSSDFTGKVNSMVLPVTVAMLDRYYSGNGCVQDVFPTLDADQREFIMTGCTPAEWESLCEYRG